MVSRNRHKTVNDESNQKGINSHRDIFDHDWGPIVTHYNACSETIPDDARAMGWASLFNQQLRFDVMMSLVDFSNQSILDVGCGDGALFHFLKNQGIVHDYKGIDISNAMILRSQLRYPGISTRCINFFDYGISHDIVLCSGALSYCPSDDSHQFLKTAIDHLFGLSTHHFVFNLLSINAPTVAPFTQYDPRWVLDYCLSVTPFVTLHHNYLLNDFTVHMSQNN